MKKVLLISAVVLFGALSTNLVNAQETTLEQHAGDKADAWATEAGLSMEGGAHEGGAHEGLGAETR